MSSAPDKFFHILQNPLKFRFFLLIKLPSAFFAGIRVKYADDSRTLVTVPYKWFTKNPFRSTYFACLSMAAEMSTGILAMAHTYGQKPISMLVTKMESSFIKKATGFITFSCEDGFIIGQTVKQALSSGKGTAVAARSIGRDTNGDVVAEFIITWSFKVKGQAQPL